MTDVWQPIETAPKDAGSILAYCATAYTPTTYETWWSPAEQAWVQYSRAEGKWHGGVGAWFPTHWREMPAPPAITEQPT